MWSARRSVGMGGLALFASLGSLPSLSAQASQYIYGIHWWKPGAEQIMNGKRGWAVEIINADGINDPGNLDGDKEKLRNLIQSGFTPLVRINWGWFATIPRPDRVSYDAFATRIAMIIDELYNDLGGGLRVQWFQIGNEYNLDYEYEPTGDGCGAPASVYAQFFNTTYQKVKTAVPGGGSVKVLVGPVANWAPNGPNGCVQGSPAQGYYYDRYFKAVVQQIPSADGYALHTYGGHRNVTLPYGLGTIDFGVDQNLDNYPGLDTSNTLGFNSFKVLMRVIKDHGNAALPVVITETNTSAHKTIRRSSSCVNPAPCNPGEDCRLIPPALTYTAGWFQEAFQKINDWNNSQSQKILALTWFVYKAEGEWTEFAIDESASCNMVQARADFSDTTRTTEYVSPGLGAPPGCTRGRPRVPYAREYWVIDSRASLAQVQEIVGQAYPNRITVGFSYDDAGIGDLSVRKVTVWGEEYDRNVLLNWYQQYYGGVSVEFRALPGQGGWRFGPYETTPPSSCRGRPRVQYAREYWVIDSRARLEAVQAIVQQGYPGRKTIGFSYDDAGIGDLDQRHVVVWGNEYDQNVLRQWYGQYYPGVTLAFQGLPLAGRQVSELAGGLQDGGFEGSVQGDGVGSGWTGFDPAAGRSSATLAVNDGRGGSNGASITITVSPPPPTPTNLVANGGFDAGLTGWSTWVERGSLSPVIAGSQLHLQSANHNGGVYQQFQTGGAGTTITVDGLWASDPTVANGQWAEVLIINGPRLPVNGQDVNETQSDVVLVYKNDTWASPGGWSGAMAQTSPVAQRRSFAASASAATIVLKSGNLGSATTGTRFDDILVMRPSNRAPTAVISANPTTGTAPLTVAFSGSGSSDPDGDPLTYGWSFGDGGQGSGVTISHTYSAAGSYSATLTVSDGRDGTHSATVTIGVLASPGPLVNGDFESSVPGSAVGTGWTAFTSSGYGATFAVVPDQVHGGSFAQRVTSPQPSSNDKYAGVYQVLATGPGRQHTVRAWNRTHFTGGNAWDHIARLGIDLTGGTDSQAGSVSWHEFDSLKDSWVGCPGCPPGQPLEVSITATGPSTTIFLQSWRKWPSGGDSFTWFDDIEVVANTPPVNRPPTAVASANPTSGPAPLTVTFDGSASTDPDGDPLSYSWSFGDGAPAAGVTISHTYAAEGTYTATLTVSDGRGTHSASLAITVEPPSGNRPPKLVISATPRWGVLPFTVTLDGSGSSDPDGDPLTYDWSFADGVQGSGPTLQRTFEDANGDMKEAGGYAVTLTVSDGQGGSASATARIGVFPSGCPSFLDFDAIRAQLDAQGKDLVFVKIGFHTGAAGASLRGLGQWERCLDAAGVPFLVKSVSNGGRIAEAASLKARSGVPHTIIYRRCCAEYELPNYNNDAEQEAEVHWQRHLQAFPQELKDVKNLIWVETINEPWKGDNETKNAEWLAKFSYHTALLAMAAGYNYAAFGWSSGEPEPGPPPYPQSPGFQWDGPEMQNFLRLAAQYPDRIAISLHEYNYGQPSLRETYPSLVGRFEKLFERCDANGIPRPTVLITEFGWPGPPPAEEMMSADNVPWAADLYAGFRAVKGAALWDAGDMSPHISALTAYSLQNYFAISRPAARPLIGVPGAGSP